MLKKIAKWKPRIARGEYPICVLCGRPIKRIKDLSTEHLIPKSRGGTSAYYNIEPAHKICNNLKGNMTMNEWISFIQRQRE